MTDDEIKVGDRVETSVAVCGDRVAVREGIVTAVHSGYCDVDVASLHGCQPWIFMETTTSLRKVVDAAIDHALNNAQKETR